MTGDKMLNFIKSRLIVCLACLLLNGASTPGPSGGQVTIDGIPVNATRQEVCELLAQRGLLPVKTVTNNQVFWAFCPGGTLVGTRMGPVVKFDSSDRVLGIWGDHLVVDGVSHRYSQSAESLLNSLGDPDGEREAVVNGYRYQYLEYKGRRFVIRLIGGEKPFLNYFKLFREETSDFESW